VRAEPLGPDQWELWRDLRLEALQDTPIGYGERHADAVRDGDERWRAVPTRPGFHCLAWSGDRPVGMAGGFVDAAGRPTVFGVYVQPAARGGRALDVLLDAVAGWARSLGARELRLEVHEDNHRAAAAYRKRGWAATGERRGYDLDPARDLLAMSLTLPPAAP
jgi:GNAT superfamily N-acetyltransferase